MQLISFILAALALPFLVSTSPVNPTSQIIRKRDDELMLSLFKGDSPTGTDASVDESQIGSVATVTLPCGAVSVKIVKNTVTTCKFNLPATMPAGTFTGTPGNGFYTISVNGACAGDVTFVSAVVNADAGDIGEVTRPACSDGTGANVNTMTLCVSGTSLIDC
jgi:hypothetical protein